MPGIFPEQKGLSRHRGQRGKYINLKLKTFLSCSISKVKNQNQMRLQRQQREEVLGKTFSLVWFTALSISNTCMSATVSVSVCVRLKCVVTREQCRH